MCNCRDNNMQGCYGQSYGVYGPSSGYGGGQFFGMQSPMMGYSMGMGGAGGFNNFNFLPMTKEGTLNVGKTDLANLIGMLPNEKDATLTPQQKAAQNAVDAAIGGTDWGAVGANIAGTALSGLNMLFQLHTMDTMESLQNNYMDKMENLSKRYMDLQETGMEIHQAVLEGNNKLVLKLANIQAEVAKCKIKYDSKTAISNTKTTAAYGYLNNKFYDHGTPAIPSQIYV